MTTNDSTSISRGSGVIRRLALARLLGLAGAEVVFTIRSFDMYRDTGSALWLSALMFAFFTGLAVGGPIAGMLGDRFPRHRVLLCAIAAQIVTLGPLIVVHDPAAIVGLTLLAAVATAPFNTVLPASVPSLVDPGRIPWANGLLNAGLNAGLILGPITGGVLLDTAGAAVGFSVALGLILLEGVLILSTRRAFTTAAAGRAGADSSFLRGLAVVRADRLLTAITIAWMILMGGLGVVLVAEVPLADAFGWGAIGYSLLAVAWGGGAVCGSLAARLVRARHELAAVALGLAGLTTALFAIALSQVPWWVMPAMFVGGFADASGEVAVHGVFQRRVADAVLARGMAVLNTAGIGALALSFLVAGPLLEAVGITGAYLVAACAAMLGLVHFLVRTRGAGLPAPAAAGPFTVRTCDEPGDGPIEVTATPAEAPSVV